MTAQLSAAQVELAKRELERRQMREHLSPFICKVFQTVDPAAIYKHNWHIDLLSEYLEACERREIQQLIINIPPRFMKSIACTIAFPAWCLGRNPSEQIGAASYSSSLATKHSLDCRTVLKSPWYRALFPLVNIKGDADTKTEYETTAQGHRFSTSVGGTATGRGGNILILDDPINPKQAVSDAERNTANEWVDQTWATRVNDPELGVKIVVMQRLHRDDVTGHLLEQGGWEHICLENEADSRKTISFGKVTVHREEGDLLHPERIDAARSDDFKVKLGSYGYAAQFQQRPAPKGGGLIKLPWFYRFSVPRASAYRIVHSWDTAQKVEELNDYTVGGSFHETDRGFDLVDIVRRKMESPDIRRAIINFAERDKPHAILIEDKSSGSGVIQDLLRETTLPIIPIQPFSDKVTRMSNCAPIVEAGNVGLPEVAPWLHDFESELQDFPNGSYRDQGDMFSQFLNWVRENPRMTSGVVEAVGEVQRADW